MDKFQIGFIGFSILIIVGLVFVTEAVRTVYSTAEDIDDTTLTSAESYVSTSTSKVISPSDEGLLGLNIKTPNQTWLSFDGVNDWVNITKKDYMSPNLGREQLTIIMRVKLNYSNAGIGALGTQYIVSKGNTNNFEWELIKRNSSADALGPYIMVQYYNLSGSTSDQTYQWIREDYKNDWYDVALIIENTTVKKYLGLYINGLSKSSQITKDHGDGNENLRIGQRANAGYYNGSIDYIRVYNTSMSNKQIMQITKGLDFIGIPVLMYHKFNNTYNDSLTINSSQLEYQLSILNNSGYNCSITDAEWYNYSIGGGFTMPCKNPLMITFDDGYTGVLYNFTRILNKYGYRKGVSIINTAFIDSGTGVYSQNSYMNWSQINELKNVWNWSIASHLDSHCHIGSNTGGTSPTWCNATNTRSGNLTVSYNKILANTGLAPTSVFFPYNDIGKWQYEMNNISQNCTGAGYKICGGEGASDDRFVPLLSLDSNLTYFGIQRIDALALWSPDAPFGFNTTVFNSSPQLYIKFNENNGTIAYDTSGNSNNGTISGATWQTDGQNITLTENVDYSHSDTTMSLLNTDYLYSWLIMDWSYSAQTSDGNRNATVLRLAGIVIISSLLFFCYWFIKEQLGWIN